MVVFYKIPKKYEKIQLTKKQNGPEQSKNEKSSTLPRYSRKNYTLIMFTIVTKSKVKLINLGSSLGGPSDRVSPDPTKLGVGS